MKKYRIIKSIAKDASAPYFIQEWNPVNLSWEYSSSSSWTTLSKAKSHLKDWKEYYANKEVPAEVVWEDEDDSR